MAKENRYPFMRSLLLCSLASFFVVIRMITGNNIALFIFLILVLAGIIFDEIENKINYLLFFISWVYAIKFDFNQYSLFVILCATYTLVSLFYIIKQKIRISLYTITSLLLIIIYTCFIILINKNSTYINEMGFILIYIVLFLGVLLLKEVSQFKIYLNMYVIGLILSGLTGALRELIPQINLFISQMTNIDTIDWRGTLHVRFTGLDLDPNYFAIQLLLAITLLIVNFYYNKKSILTVIQCMVLSAMGFATFSKMFLLMIGIILLYSLFVFTKTNPKALVKYIVGITLIISAIVIPRFNYIMEVYLDRFLEEGGGLNGLTTGRINIWAGYINQMFHNFKILIVGNGYGTIFQTSAPHNMYITAIYQLGMLGTAAFLYYFYALGNLMKKKCNNNLAGIKLNINILPLAVLMISNLALDSFIMDFFPFHLLLVLFALHYSKYKEEPIRRGAYLKSRKIFTKRGLVTIMQGTKYAIGYCCYRLIRCSKYKYDKPIWLLAERNNEARDNGYHLFKYIRTNYPKVPVFYIIKHKSPDYNKLIPFGNIIRFGSIKHHTYYFLAAKHISTHINGCMPSAKVNSAMDQYLQVHAKKIFLQHGIIKDYLPQISKAVANLDLFVCGAFPEYNYVKENYGYENEVKYVGLARFDGLHNYEVKNQILLMPTFRMSLFIYQEEPTTVKNEKNFMSSNYYIAYQSLINNDNLIQLLTEHGIELIFYPHFEVQRYIHLFHANNQLIKIAAMEDYDIQALLKESKLLITDYSSVYFDFAYMNKPVLYYQFDYDQYREEHYKEGYYSYEVNGFGNVIRKEEDLLNEISDVINSQFELSAKYSERIKQFFPLHDTDNCKRNFEVIQQL